MKHILLFILICFVASGCQQNSTQSKNLKFDSGKAFIENLKTKDPVEEAALKKFFPNELLGIPLSNLFVTKSKSPVSTKAYAIYELNGIQYRVSIIDGAGEFGSSLVSKTYDALLKKETNVSHDGSYERFGEHFGHPCIERRSVALNSFGLETIQNNRFFVFIETDQSDFETTKSVLEILDLSKLNNL